MELEATTAASQGKTARPTMNSIDVREYSERFSRVGLILLLGLFVTQVRSQDKKPEFLCRQTEEAIRIDGKADENAWTTAQTISPFLIPLGKESRETETITSAKLLWDDKHLYFFAEMEDEDLLAKVKQHDGPIWFDDVFELFFKPKESEPGYYEFEINAMGIVLDMFIPEYSADLYEKHKSERKFSVVSKVLADGTVNNSHDKDKGWSVEGRIPWTDFAVTGGKPDPGAQWLFNLCRYDYSSVSIKKPELSVSGPEMPGDFHAHQYFSKIRFVGPWDPREDLPEHVQKIAGFGGSKLIGSPDPPLPYTVAPAFEKHRVSRLITFKFEPDTGRMIYVDQPPGVKNSRLMRYDPKTGGEQILLDPPEIIYDVEFHPRFEENGQIFLSVHGPAEADRFDKRVQVFRFVLDRNSDLAPKFEDGELIIEWPSRGHTGGAMAFDDEGLFYLTTGDGTSDSDTNLAGQNLSVIHAKVLRIDLEHTDGGRAYSIPPDNPFLDRKNVRPETFAYGLRNPWRSDWDHKLKRLWVGNNGQDRLEQVYLIERGGNYGWSVYEGSGVFYGERERGPDPILLPTAEHDHGESRSLTGGIVYTGDKYPDLKNAYLYGDHSTGKIWAVLHDGEKVVWDKEIADTSLKITEFGVDPETGDLLISSHENVPAGGLYRLVPNETSSTAQEFPKLLSETGMFQSVEDHQVMDALLPYSVIVPEWLDGAKADRFLCLPDEEARFSFAPRRGWTFPDGTVAIQTIFDGEGKQARRIESRILKKEQNEWAAYSYLWNEEQTDASLVSADGFEKEINGRKWKVPSRSDCMVCHSRAANFVLGLQTPQMNRDHDYGGGYVRNQLELMNDLGFFLRSATGKRNSTLRGPAEEQPRLTDPFDSSALIDLRARSYLHATCAHCHVESGGGNASMDLRDFVDFERFNVIGVAPKHSDQGLGKSALLIAPGDPSNSVLVNRCVKTGPGKMPPMGSLLPDSRAVAMLMEWVAGVEMPPAKIEETKEQK